MVIRERISSLGTSASLLGAWVVVASAGAVLLDITVVAGGDGYAISRVLIGVVGLTAGFTFWSGRNFFKDGLLAIIVWGRSCRDRSDQLARRAEASTPTPDTTT